MKMTVHDSRVCRLGEGPLWHPERQQLFWFDILGNRLMTRDASGQQEWLFDENVSAAGWVDRDVLLIASESCLFRFNLVTGHKRQIAPLEADSPATRSNDGRADPWGGFWIGTMGKSAQPGAGAIYRYYKGELRQLFTDITVPNAICFPPDAPFAYYTDTLTRQVMRQPLNPATGWPEGAAELFLDLTEDGLNPDGAVVDAAGTLWIAQWGAARVAAYAPDGTFVQSIAVDAVQSSCPAFGGPDLDLLYCTSAAVTLPDMERATLPGDGMTFVTQDLAGGAVRGQAEHRVIL